MTEGLFHVLDWNGDGRLTLKGLYNALKGYAYIYGREMNDDAKDIVWATIQHLD